MANRPTTRLSTGDGREKLTGVRPSPGQPRPARKIAGGTAKGTPPEPAPWVTRWSAVIVAVITTVGVVAAALIALHKPDPGPVPAAALTTSSIDFDHGADGQEISIDGTVKNWNPAVGYIFGLAKPKDNGHIVDSQTKFWYVGGPALVGPDGRWSVVIKVGSNEKRDLSVSAALLPSAGDVQVGEPAPPGASPTGGVVPPPSGPDNARLPALLTLLGVNGPQNAVAETPPQDVRTTS